MIHGIASSSTTFRNLFPLLADHRVVAMDLLGFGESLASPTVAFTIEEHVRALRDAIASLRLREPYVLVGHSMGALIASRFAASHPRRLAALVLVSPPIYVAPTALGDRGHRREMLTYLKGFESLRRNKWLTIREAKIAARLSGIRGSVEVNEANWLAFALSLEHVIEQQTSVSDIANAAVPIWIVYGTLDPLILPATLRIVERMRHVTIEGIPGADHVIRRRMARAVARAIAAAEQAQTH
jgi:pimeloyl-ACP methyl ester carboxylesterase